MADTTKKNGITKHERIIYAVFAYMIFMFIVVVTYRGEQRITERSTVTNMTLEGIYSVDNGLNFIDYVQYKPRRCKMSTTMIFEGHFTQDIAESEKVWLRVENMNVKVIVNGQSVYNNDEFDDYLIWDYFRSPGITTQDDICIEMEVRNPIPFNFLFSKLLDTISVGTKYSLTKSNIIGNLAYIIMSICIFMMGVVLVPYCFQLKYLEGENAQTEGMMSCSLMLMFGAVNCFINHKYTGLMVDNLYGLTYISFMVKMVTSVFTVRYVDKFVHRKAFKHINRVFGYINIIRVTAYMAILIMTGNDIISRTVFVVIASIGCLILFVEMIFVILDYVTGEREGSLEVYSTVFLMVCLIVEILFYILTGTYITRMLTVGLMVFTVTEWVTVSRRNLQNVIMARKAQTLENELTQNQVKMMISQIQPHFLYNALGTIKALCVKDPQTARTAIDSFAKYLRANMDSLNNKECIPFSRELDHTKCYLYIEQLRFGDLLRVEYDIQTQDFEIPALSLQTMAENAVKHGLLAKREGGTLKISTFEGNTYYEVRIEDDGVGFDINQPVSDGRSHVGVTNTRQRIAAMCGGNVSIGSKLGVGTIITIVIPKNGNK